MHQDTQFTVAPCESGGLFEVVVSLSSALQLCAGLCKLRASAWVEAVGTLPVRCHCLFCLYSHLGLLTRRLHLTCSRIVFSSRVENTGC